MLVSYLGAKTAKKKLLFRKIDTTLKNLEINTIIANMPASVSLSSNYMAKRALKIETGSDKSNDGDGIVIDEQLKEMEQLRGMLIIIMFLLNFILPFPSAFIF